MMTLRFNAKQRQGPRDYFSRGEQVRLLAMVAALGAVVLAMSQLRRPEGAAALDRMLTGRPAAAQDDADRDVAKPARADQPAWLAPELLATIRDNTHFRDAESEAWFAVIEQLQASPNGLDSPDTHQTRNPQSGPFLEKRRNPQSSDPSLSYAQLLQQPDVYRGRPVTVAGAIRRVEKVTPAENDLGLNHYFRVIIRPEGREAWPIFVYALDRPDRVPLDELVSRAMTARGVFFKNLSYRSESGMGVAPVLLARRVNVAPLPPATAPTPVVTPSSAAQVALIAGAIAAAVVLLLWLRRPGLTRSANSAPADLDFDRLARDATPPGDQP